ncbi:CCR4-NOT transcription complex subunit 2 [Metschnikowia aff. pulcherrima]|uniref:CCR4-NOT transcription complex subunit 2 n=1 Tax=Metschnikowia aff. pulcherrima TaxID=2163413 RepID=A0A4P6XJ05_9ASCO|nr:CCR4-NOT transcription complex subunit 2 [Metschnikowia aff. pulcherrima]
MSSVLPPGLLGTTITSQTAADGSRPANQKTLAAEMPPISKFGLDGLASLLKNDENEQTAFAVGQNLQLMGLDLSEDSEILKTLASPWQETSRLEVEPYFTLPDNILQKNIVPKPEPCDTKILSFLDETLFYIFYTKPRDTLQEYASRELVARNWRYHRDIQVWLTKDSNVEPVLISPDVERGVYVFFDPHNWEKIRKEFVLHYSSVQA